MRHILKEISTPSGRAVPTTLPTEGIFTLFGNFGRLLLARHSTALTWGFAVLAAAVAGGLRLMLDPVLPPGLPFVTFFPAVLITLIYAGLRAGIIMAVLGGLIAWARFVSPADAFALQPSALTAMGFYLLITGSQVFFFAATVAALRAHDIVMLRAAEHARSRELMFAELQHRVSNNLSTVAALLRMQASRSREAQVKKALTEATQRITTVARLQRSLHSPDMQDVEAKVFLETLAADTLEAAHLEAKPKVDLSIAEHRLTRDQAVPLGLIASDLMMNAVEHGVSGQAAPEIRVSFGPVAAPADGPQVALVVRDNGASPPEGFDLEKSTSLGLSIARQFAQQLGGTLTIRPAAQGGTESRLAFPPG